MMTRLSKVYDEDGALYALLSDGYQLTRSLDGVYLAIMENRELVLRALGMVPHVPAGEVGPGCWWFNPQPSSEGSR